MQIKFIKNVTVGRICIDKGMTAEVFGGRADFGCHSEELKSASLKQRQHMGFAHMEASIVNLCDIPKNTYEYERIWSRLQKVADERDNVYKHIVDALGKNPRKRKKMALLVNKLLDLEQRIVIAEERRSIGKSPEDEVKTMIEQFRAYDGSPAIRIPKYDKDIVEEETPNYQAQCEERVRRIFNDYKKCPDNSKLMSRVAYMLNMEMQKAYSFGKDAQELRKKLDAVFKSEEEKKEEKVEVDKNYEERLVRYYVRCPICGR
jgi:hypothetical protein